ncbi:MAG: hypothetical protein OdinLCB4_001080 [Candidatus Odinarchaeum yellowstonii]|uniref:Uncharacterized protein n=1 Tax=Odinarchaeota yellowstonii (strain LCB_4) TaxID=1841599 RepID=A0AAF0IBA4_ODILC|nr:MAG: hypothetical protein OdinLCB4_001080 [Candidatus Odinarchaeum yellowstonii]
MPVEEDLNAYKEALRIFNKFLNAIRNVVFDKYPDLLSGTDLKDKIRDIDNVQKKIDELMVQFKKLFTEKLLVLTAMRSLLWHVKTTIEDSDNVKELKERLRIFILPEVERFLNSFKRESALLRERIKPLFKIYENIKTVLENVEMRDSEFERLIKPDEKGMTRLDEVLQLILEDKLDELDRKYSELLRDLE